MPSSCPNALPMAGSVSRPIASRIASALRSCSSCLFCRVSSTAEMPSAMRETTIEALAKACSVPTARRLQSHQASQDDALHFVGAFADLVDLLVSVHPRNGVLVHEPVAAVNLQGVVDDAVRKLAGKELGEARRLHVVAAAILFPCRPQHHQLRVFDLGEHVDEFERDRLKLTDRSEERVTFPG